MGTPLKKPSHIDHIERKIALSEEAWQTSTMLNLVGRRSIWPESLAPIGQGDIDKEDFASWHARVGHRLEHLPPQLLEEWVHRHWLHSPFAFLDLNALRVREEMWSTDDILGQVAREWGITPNPAFDRTVFHGRFGPISAAKGWRNGTWDYPMVILETPNGFLGHDGPQPEARYLLVEGHQRLRYLNLKHSEGGPTGPHRMFVLTSEEAPPPNRPAPAS